MKGEVVDAGGVVLVGGAGVLREGFAQGAAPLGRESRRQELLGQVYAQCGLGGLCRKAAVGLGYAVCVGYVGFDVVDGGGVHHVRAGDAEDGAVLYGEESYGGEAEAVRAEWGARGEYAYAGVSAEAWRAYCGACI